MNKKFLGLTAGLALFLAACGSETATEESVKVSVGVVSEVEVEVWEDVKSA